MNIVKYEWFYNSPNLNLGIAAASVATLFIIHITLLRNMDPFKNLMLNESLQSLEFQQSAAVFASSAIPIILEIISDFLFKPASPSNEKLNNYRVGRGIISVSVLFIGLTWCYFPYHFRVFKSIGVAYTFTLTAAQIIIPSSLLFILNTSNPEIYQLSHTSFLTVLTSLVYGTKYFGIMYGDNSAMFATTSLIGYSLLFFIVMRKFFKLYRYQCQLENCTSLVYSVLLLINYLICFLDITMKQQFDEEIQNIVGPLVLNHTYMFALLIMAISIIPTRVTNLEAIQDKDQLLDSKNAYVRYLSHELRNPLNTVFTGLKLGLSKSSSKLFESCDNEMHEVLSEATVACDAALDVLNEFLLYDKLETGVINLNREEVNVLELVNSCADMIKVQLREKNINFRVSNNDGYDSSIDADRSIKNAVQTEDCDLNDTCILSTDTINVDRNKICQVIRNFLSNAVKFTPYDGHIEIRMKFINESLEIVQIPSTLNCIDNNVCSPNNRDIFGHLSGYLVIEVVDDGAGISKQNQSRLFNEVVQFHPERLQAGGGSGLGMFLSKGIVDMHNGTISVYSESEGLGTTFRLELPMTRNKKDYAFKQEEYSSNPDLKCKINALFFEPISSRSSCAELSAAIEPINSLSFLVVDDSNMNRKMLMRLLKHQGCTCEGAIDGLDAVNKITQALQYTSISNPPSDYCVSYVDTDLHTNNESISNRTAVRMYDYILMDFDMPNMNGIEATRIIKSLGFNGKIIGVTGNTSHNAIDQFLNAGASCVLSKPMKIEDLFKVIHGAKN